MFSKMHCLAQWFVVSVEVASLTSIRFLDMMVCREGPKLKTMPYLKDPGLAKRLSAQSAHPWSVHVAWPAMMMKTSMKLASSAGDAEMYRVELIERLKNDGCVVPPKQGVQVGKANLALSCLAPKTVFWLSLGYHPWWYRTVKRAASRFNNDCSFSSMLSSAVPSWQNSIVKIAWKNALPQTQMLIQKA